jgi:hypothetical protein
MFSSPDGVKKTGMGFMGALRPKQALLQQRMANPGPYSCRPFIPESLPSATAAGSSRGLAKRYEYRALVAGKQVKIGRSCADFECCENGTKAKFIRGRSSARRHCAAVGKALKIDHNIPHFRDFFQLLRDGFGDRICHSRVS